MKKVMTILFIRNETNILLGMKKRGFGTGIWNGFGGKVEEKESILEGAIREVREESGLVLDPNDVNKIGTIHFERKSHEVHPYSEVHIYEARKYSGEIMESEEMSPKWFEIQQLPEQMWPDAVFWLPYVLRNQTFTAYVLYKNDNFSYLRLTTDQIWRQPQKDREVHFESAQCSLAEN